MAKGGGSPPPQGLTPLQLERFSEGTQLVDKYLPKVGGQAKTLQDIMGQQNDLATEFNTLGSGGLLDKGMEQFNKSAAAPDLGQGIMQRQMGRMGIAPTVSQQAANNLKMAQQKASAEVGAANQTRAGLVTAMQNLSFGGGA